MELLFFFLYVNIYIVIRSKYFIIDLGARLDKRRTETQRVRQLIIYYLARLRHPEKQNLPSSRHRQRYDGKEKRGARLFRRGKNPATWSPFRRPLREYLARTHTHMCACTHILVRMQSGANWYWKISKSIKTRGTKDSARQNTNYLMSSLVLVLSPVLSFLCPVDEEEGDWTEWEGGREGGLFPLQELNSIRHWSE